MLNKCITKGKHALATIALAIAILTLRTQDIQKIFKAQTILFKQTGFVLQKI